MGELVEIGNYIKLSSDIDQKERVTNYVRNNLAVVDLLPVDYTLTLGNLGNKTEWATKYEFTTAQKAFTDSCLKYGLKEYKGLRLWITDDTTAVDDISSDFELNVIEKGVSSIAGMSKQIEAMKNLIMSTGSDYTTQFKDAVTGGTKDESAVSAATNTAAGMVIQGKKLALPKIWASSRYDPSLSLNLKLVSPYGNPTSIRNYIVEPLIYLLILGAAKTSDGVSYGLTKPIKVIAYGISNMNLAYIRNINVRRGGRESSYNIYRQPLVLDISITISPLVEGFAAVDKDRDDIAVISDVETSELSHLDTGPAITTVGNMIRSFVPIPKNILLSENKGENELKPMGGRNSIPTHVNDGLLAL